jgi:hypothetical protein
MIAMPMSQSMKGPTMTKVIFDQTTLSKLRSGNGAVEICDESGRLMGHFYPAQARSLYKNLVIPITEEELERREKELGGRPLAEILADLEKKA